jgi:hypothetical protein
MENINFDKVHHLFTENNWDLVINEYRHLLYTKRERETEFIEITLEYGKIWVSVPLSNSVYQYKTGFNDYYSTNAYLESRCLMIST